MAKQTKKEIKTEKVEKVNEDINENIVQTEETPSEVEMLRAQLEEMKKAMAEMMSKASAPSQSVVLKEAEDEVEVGCRMLQGIGLNSEDGTVSVDISFNDTQSLTISEVKKLFRRAHIKKLFEDGVCYFEDETNYQAFNIRNHKDLSDESLISLLTSFFTLLAI